MIQSWKSKALKRAYSGDVSGLGADIRTRVLLALRRLDIAVEPNDMAIPGLRLHPLYGDLQGYWSITITGNWRIIFRFEDGNVHDVELVDYH